MPRGRKLFPGLAALPVSCGKTVFHGVAVFYGWMFSTVLFGTSNLIQMTTHGSEWWKRRKQTILNKGWGDSTLSRRISMLNPLVLGLERSTTVLHFLPNPRQHKILNLKFQTVMKSGIRAS